MPHAAVTADVLSSGVFGYDAAATVFDIPVTRVVPNALLVLSYVAEVDNTLPGPGSVVNDETPPTVTGLGVAWRQELEPPRNAPGSESVYRLGMQVAQHVNAASGTMRLTFPLRQWFLMWMLTQHRNVPVGTDGLDAIVQNLFTTSLSPQFASAPKLPTNLSLAMTMYSRQNGLDPTVTNLSKLFQSNAGSNAGTIEGWAVGAAGSGVQGWTISNGIGRSTSALEVGWSTVRTTGGNLRQRQRTSEQEGMRMASKNRYQ